MRHNKNKWRQNRIIVLSYNRTNCINMAKGASVFHVHSFVISTWYGSRRISSREIAYISLTHNSREKW